MSRLSSGPLLWNRSPAAFEQIPESSLFAIQLLRSDRWWCTSTDGLDEVNYFVVMERLPSVYELDNESQHLTNYSSQDALLKDCLYVRCGEACLGVWRNVLQTEW
jgi:hypothetical protein